MEDGGHYYLRDGTPCHTVPKRGGGMRNFNIQWDRHLKAVPSSTTVLKIIDKPQLTSWLVEQGIRSALSFPKGRGDFLNDAEFIKAIREDSKQQVIDAANESIRIHAAIEDHFSGKRYPAQYEPHVDGALKELRRIFPLVNDWVAEARFAHPSGYGGSSDLHSPSTGIVCDWKGKDGELWCDDEHAYAKVTKDGVTKDKRCDYDQVYQIASYQDGIMLPRAQGAALFFSRTHPGSTASKVWSADEMEQGSRIFKAALQLHKLLKNYDGSWA